MRKIPPFILINLFYSNFQAIVCDVLVDFNCNFSQPSFLHVTEYNKKIKMYCKVPKVRTIQSYIHT